MGNSNSRGEGEGDTTTLPLYRCGMGYNSRSYKRARAQAQAEVSSGEAWCRVCGGGIGGVRRERQNHTAWPRNGRDGTGDRDSNFSRDLALESRDSAVTVRMV